MCTSMSFFKVGADQIRKPYRTGSGWYDSVVRTGPDRIRVLEKNVWIFHESRAGWPKLLLHWPYFWSPRFPQITDWQVNEKAIDIWDQGIYDMKKVHGTYHNCDTEVLIWLMKPLSNSFDHLSNFHTYLTPTWHFGILWNRLHHYQSYNFLLHRHKS